MFLETTNCNQVTFKCPLHVVPDLGYMGDLDLSRWTIGGGICANPTTSYTWVANQTTAVLSVATTAMTTTNPFLVQYTRQRMILACAWSMVGLELSIASAVIAHI